MYCHYAEQTFNTGLKLELLQKYVFVALDIFQKNIQNKITCKFENKLEAWLTFLSEDDPEIILKLIETYPEFKALYEDGYRLCLNIEEVMRMFSKELAELDKNTVQLMIDEMQDELDEKNDILAEMKIQISEKDNAISEIRTKLSEKDNAISEKDHLIDDKNCFVLRTPEIFVPADFLLIILLRILLLSGCIHALPQASYPLLSSNESGCFVHSHPASS